MEPVIMALTFSRWQISRPTSEVMRSSEGRPINCKAFWILDSGTMLRKGDWSSWEARACFSVPSKTASPVVFTNSVSKMESFSLRALVRRVNTRLEAVAASRTAAATPAQSHVFERARWPASGEAGPALAEAATCEPEAAERSWRAPGGAATDAPEETELPADEAAEGKAGCPAAPESPARAIEPELRAESSSRLR